MAQWVEGLAAKADDLSLIPCTHIGKEITLPSDHHIHRDIKYINNKTKPMR